MTRFDACMKEVPLRCLHEGGSAVGGWLCEPPQGVNHPKDPGGETKYGISKRSYPQVDIAALTEADAKEIYRRDFWAKIRGDDLPAGIDLATLDPSINSGRARGVRWMQQGLGIMADGVMGPGDHQGRPGRATRRGDPTRLCGAHGLPARAEDLGQFRQGLVAPCGGDRGGGRPHGH